MTKLIQLSASKINTFNTCPDWYISDYILRYPKGKSTYGLLGSAIHSALERAYLYGETPHIVYQDYINDTLRQWDSTGEGYTGYSYSQLMSQGFDILDSFDFTLYKPLALGNEKLAIEYGFLLPFPSAQNALCNIKGYIDLIDERRWIVDFKSAKVLKESDLNSIQLAVYSWAYTQLYSCAPEKVITHHLRSGMQYPADMQKLDEWIPKIEELVKRILSLDKRVPVRCTHCQFFCPLFYQERKHSE